MQQSKIVRIVQYQLQSVTEENQTLSFAAAVRKFIAQNDNRQIKQFKTYYSAHNIT